MNGESSPFGNGKGTAAMPQSNGHNFVANPQGPAMPPMTSTDAASGGQPESYLKDRPQQAGADPINPNEIPEGGSILYADAKPDAGNPLGVGTIGNPAKPYKLSGG
jgi:hypothetical protein